jgi:hypothetical protein
VRVIFDGEGERYGGEAAREAERRLRASFPNLGHIHATTHGVVLTLSYMTEEEAVAVCGAIADVARRRGLPVLELPAELVKRAL